MLIENLPAKSRNRDERAKGAPDSIVTNWHVHFVESEQFSGTLVYGTQKNEQVALMIVIPAMATTSDGKTIESAKRTVLVIEPREDAPSEKVALEEAVRSRNPEAPSAVMMEWMHDEFLRLEQLVPGARPAAGGTSPKAESLGAFEVPRSRISPQGLQLSNWCVARLATMGLVMASGIWLGPVGVIALGTLEALAWGDFSAAAPGPVAAGGVLANRWASNQEAVQLLKVTGKIVGRATPWTLGGIAVVGLLVDPKGVLVAAAPPQCLTNP